MTKNLSLSCRSRGRDLPPQPTYSVLRYDGTYVPNYTASHSSRTWSDGGATGRYRKNGHVDRKCDKGFSVTHCYCASAVAVATDHSACRNISPARARWGYMFLGCTVQRGPAVWPACIAVHTLGTTLCIPPWSDIRDPWGKFTKIGYMSWPIDIALSITDITALNCADCVKYHAQYHN
jgi:hypothetical protein